MNIIIYYYVRPTEYPNKSNMLQFDILQDFSDQKSVYTCRQMAVPMQGIRVLGQYERI